MIVSTMTSKEVTKEIYEDWIAVTNSLDRLGLTYDRERRRGRIDKSISYGRAYEIKTKKKNTWIFILSKAPSVEKYKDTGSINICSLVYYYNSIGIRVFKIIPGGGLSVYNGHLFKRYNERMNLGLSTPLEIVKHFFISNGYFISKILPRWGGQFALSVCKEGLLLGEVQEGKSWLVHKTFITREDAVPDQEDLEQGLLKNLQKDIEAEINKPEFNQDQYYYKADTLKGIIS